MSHLTRGAWMGRPYAKCHGCGAVAYFHSSDADRGSAAFARQHQGCGERMRAPAAAGYGGLGDVVAAGTKAMGIEPCTPCERRRAMLNRVAPRVFRR